MKFLHSSPGSKFGIRLIFLDKPSEVHSESPEGIEPPRNEEGVDEIQRKVLELSEAELDGAQNQTKDSLEAAPLSLNQAVANINILFRSYLNPQNPDAPWANETADYFLRQLKKLSDEDYDFSEDPTEASEAFADFYNEYAGGMPPIPLDDPEAVKVLAQALQMLINRLVKEGHVEGRALSTDGTLTKEHFMTLSNWVSKAQAELKA